MALTYCAAQGQANESRQHKRGTTKIKKHTIGRRPESIQLAEPIAPYEHRDGCQDQAWQPEGLAQKNTWPGGICGMPPGQHCPDGRSSQAWRNDADAEAGKQLRLRGSGYTEGAVRLPRVAVCNFLYRKSSRSHKISFYLEALITVCALNLAPHFPLCKLFISPPQ